MFHALCMLLPPQSILLPHQIIMFSKKLQGVPFLQLASFITLVLHIGSIRDRMSV